MGCNCDHVPNAGELLKRDFSPDEITTVYDLMSCLHGPPSNSNFRRIVMLILRGHYASSLNYPADMAHLNCYQWASPDTAGRQGTLKVDYANTFNDKDPHAAPGIYVGFGGQDSTKLGLGGGHHSHSDDRATENLARGGRLVIRVHHITETASGGDSYDLAEMTNLVLMALARVVREMTGAAGFEVVSYGDATKHKLSSGTNHYEVVLLLEISYTLGAALSEETHRIRTMSGIISATF